MMDAVLDQLRRFDGKSVEPFRAVLDWLPDEPEILLELADIAARREESSLEVGATWLIKERLSAGATQPPRFTGRLVRLLLDSASPHARLHLLQCLQHLRFNRREATRLTPALEDWTESEAPFLRAWAYDGLWRVAQIDPGRLPAVEARMRQAMTHEKASVKARIRRLLKVFAGVAFLLSVACTPPESLQPSIELIGDEAFFDRELGLRVVGLAPDREVTLQVEATDSRDQLWRSTGRFRPDAEGVVDPAVTAPGEGSYTGAHAMGLFWSMTGHERFSTGGSAKVTVTVSSDGTELARRDLLWLSPRNHPDVVHEPIREPGLTANLWLPRESEGPLQPVIVVGGSGGGFNSERAALLAGRGYAALDVAYFEAEGRPEYFLEPIPLEYFMGAVDRLTADPRIDTTHLAILGKSYGAQLVLLWASHDPRIKGVISEAPSSFVTGTVSTLPEGPNPSAWSLNGRPFPFLRGASDPPQPTVPEQITIDTSGPDALDQFPAAARAAIPVERISGPVLLISGEADRIWEATRMADQLMRRLTPEAGYAHTARHVRYPDAGHNLAGGQQAYGVPNLPPKDRGDSRGGSRQGNSVAGVAAWQELLAFLEALPRRE